MATAAAGYEAGLLVPDSPACDRVESGGIAVRADGRVWHGNDLQADTAVVR